jgi:hypothetical protein
MAIRTTTGAAFDAGAPISLFQLPFSVDPVIDQYAVARDGQRFIFGALDDSAAPITVVLNWAAGLTASQAGTGRAK